MVSTELRAAGLAEDKLSTGASVLKERSFDWGTDPDEGTIPDVVVWPESTDDVVTVMETATEHGIPVTPYAAGTSLEGNPVPAEGGICLDVSRMDSIVDVRPEDFQIDVQPGVFGSAVDEAANGHGLFFPPLPSSGKISTIGGMVANDASGMQTVKYGEIHDWVLRIEAVLADGTVVETGGRAAKTSSGYNLMDLLVGSEGTLGVMTEITLELAGIPKQIHGGRVIFRDRSAASAAVSDVIQSGVDVAKIELIDALSAEITNAYLDADFPDAPMMFVEFHADHDIGAEIDFFRSIVSEHGAVEIEISESDEGMAELWEIREEMAEALEPYDPDLVSLTPGDVTVPMSEFTDLMGYISTLEDEHDLLIPCFGHAGDGNIHYTVMVDADDPDAYERGKAVYDEIVRYAIEQGGTATGEHGVGIGKRDLLAEEHAEGTVELMQRVKRAFDPDGILNPGKVFPEEP
jgi:D-lactate dehydrogenase (cytochrome)